MAEALGPGAPCVVFGRVDPALPRAPPNPSTCPRYRWAPKYPMARACSRPGLCCPTCSRMPLQERPTISSPLEGPLGPGSGLAFPSAEPPGLLEPPSML